jgi:DeoR/GlpR family transcriptional regulator of sugar metabolism
MTLNQRRLEILNLIREDGQAKVQKLSNIFKVSEVTIRQDLEVLEDMGYVQREYGGAFLKDVGSFATTGTLINESVKSEEKKELARKAVALIQEGDSIILDSGSTTTELAKLMTGFNNLTVITNALNIAMILGGNHGINLLVSGGEFKAPTLSLTGDIAAATIKGIHVNKCFLATAGISADMQLTYPSLSDLVVKSTMIRAADKVYLLADSSKIGVSSFATLGRLSLIDTLITDSKITPEQAEAIRDLKVEVI